MANWKEFLKGVVATAAAIVASWIPGVGAMVSLVALGRARYYFTKAFRKLDKRLNYSRTNLTDSKAKAPIVYGRAKVGIRIADMREQESNGHFWIVGALCAGSRDGTGIEAIHEIYLDEELAVNSSGTVVGRFNGKMAKYTRTGSSSQTVISALSSAFPSDWPSTSRGKGIAHLALDLTPDKDTWGNIPEVTAIVDGRRVYDPRDSTWKYSDNPALCIRDYLLDPIHGPGFEASGLVDSDFETEADYCDELVSVPDGAGGSTTQKRFTCDGIVDPIREWTENLHDLESSCLGHVVPRGNGKIGLFIPKVKSPTTFELNEDNIIGDWEFEKGGGENVPNLVKMTFPDSEQDWQPFVAQYPEVGASNSYLANDNDYESVLEVDLPFTSDYYRAQQIAQVMLNEARQDTACVMTANEEALQLVVGDVVPVTHSTPDWTSKPFWVLGLHISPAGLVRPILSEYDPAAYSLATLSDRDTIPDTNLPNPYSVADPSSLSLLSDATTALTSGTGGTLARIKVTWTKSTHPWLDYTEIFARKQGTSEWDVIGRVDARDDQRIHVMDVSAGQTWEVGIQAVNTLGRRSGMVTDTVEISDPTEPPHVNDPPSDPVLSSPGVVVGNVTVAD